MEGYTMAMAGNYGYFVIMIVIAVLGWVVQHNLKKKFEKYSQEYIPYTGAQVAQMMLDSFGLKPMHVFGFVGTLMFIIGFLAVMVVGATKLYYLHSGVVHPLVTDSPYFYIALTMMILGTQLFVAGFLGELISRNAPERNNYQIECEL